MAAFGSMGRNSLCAAFLLVLTTACSPRHSQEKIAEYYLDRMGEVYFKFRVSDRGSLDSLTRMISIDNVEGSDLRAYANRDQFRRFLQTRITYTVLVHPGLRLQAKPGDPDAPPGKWD
jgi:hypothetical protein